MDLCVCVSVFFHSTLCMVQRLYARTSNKFTEFLLMQGCTGILNLINVNATRAAAFHSRASYS